MKLRAVLILLFFCLMQAIETDYPTFVPFDESVGTELIFGFYGPQDYPNYLYLKDLYSRNYFSNLEAASQYLIPPTCHHIWLGQELPELYRAFRQTCIANNPGWHFVLWVDNPANYSLGSVVAQSFQELEDYLHDAFLIGKTIIVDVRNLPLMTRDLFEKSPNYGQKSDILRYEVLWRFGGVYLDTDIECFKSLDVLHHYYEFYAGFSNTKTVELQNALIASMPGHPLLRALIDNLSVPDKVTCMDDVLNTTGPRYFTKIFMEEVPIHNDRMIIMPSSFFFPLPQFVRTQGYQDAISWVKPESFTNHYWSVSWWKNR